MLLSEEQVNYLCAMRPPIRTFMHRANDCANAFGEKADCYLDMSSLKSDVVGIQRWMKEMREWESDTELWVREGREWKREGERMGERR